MYKQGKFKEHEFTDRFSHVTNVTTPEFLVPLAFIPISEEEEKLRMNPIAPMPAHQGGRGVGRVFNDRDGGRGGKGRGRGGKGERDGWGPRGSSEGNHSDEHARPRQWESGDVRNSGERPTGGRGGSTEAFLPSGLPAPLIAPPPPKEWCYRDLEGVIQGPFSEEQISEWHRLNYLPANLQIRCTEDPPDAYVPLSQMGPCPPFVLAHRARQNYAAELERRQREQSVSLAPSTPNLPSWRIVAHCSPCK